MTEKQKAKKALIVQQAYEYLLDSGVDSFSLNKLLESIPMSKGNFYHYFKNKDELFYTVIQKKYEEIYVQYAMFASTNTFIEKLENLYFIYLIKNETIDEYLHLVNQMFPLFLDKNNTYLSSYMVEYYDFMNSSIEKLLKDEIKAGNLQKSILNMKTAISCVPDGMYSQNFCVESFDMAKELRKFFHSLEELYRVN